MGKFNITSSSLNNQYTFGNESVIVQGNYNMDATNNQLQNVSGTAYRKDEQGQQGEYIGNFTGYMKNGVVKYSMSEMSRRDSNMVWDAIDEIEANILGENSNSEI